MEKKSWLIIFIMLALIALVFIFWDKFIIKNEEIIASDYCEEDRDCVLAVNPSNCCACPISMNKDVVELDEDFVMYEAGRDYSSYNEGRELCSRVECAACVNPSQIKCLDNKCVAGVIDNENLEFSYNVSVSDFDLNEYYRDNLSIEDIDFIIEPSESPENFTEIIIEENSLIIKQAFAKPNPCTSMDYAIQKNKGIINIIPKIIPSNDNGMGCTGVIAYDKVEINIILESGEYLVKIYEFWNLDEPFFNKTIII